MERTGAVLGFSLVARPAGDGRVDFDWLFEQLALHGRYPSVILEHWPPFAGTIEDTIRMEEEWVARSMRFLKAKANGLAPAAGPFPAASGKACGRPSGPP